MMIKRLSLFCMVSLLICLVGCGNSEKKVENIVNTTTEEAQTVKETEEPVESESTTEPTIEDIPIIYEDDSTINLYLVRYNEANPDAQIESSDFDVYYHHGQDHKDQIIFTDSGLESILVSSRYGNKIEVNLDGGETEDDYKQAFFRYAKGYNSSFSEDTLEDYWKQILESSSNFITFDEFEVNVNRFNDVIEYIVISGSVE